MGWGFATQPARMGRTTLLWYAAVYAIGHFAGQMACFFIPLALYEHNYDLIIMIMIVTPVILAMFSVLASLVFAASLWSACKSCSNTCRPLQLAFPFALGFSTTLLYGLLNLFPYGFAEVLFPLFLLGCTLGIPIFAARVLARTLRTRHPDCAVPHLDSEAQDGAHTTSAPGEK